MAIMDYLKQYYDPRTSPGVVEIDRGVPIQELAPNGAYKRVPGMTTSFAPGQPAPAHPMPSQHLSMYETPGPYGGVSSPATVEAQQPAPAAPTAQQLATLKRPAAPMGKDAFMERWMRGKLQSGPHRKAGEAAYGTYRRQHAEATQDYQQKRDHLERLQLEETKGEQRVKKAEVAGQLDIDKEELKQGEITRRQGLKFANSKQMAESSYKAKERFMELEHKYTKIEEDLKSGNAMQIKRGTVLAKGAIEISKQRIAAGDAQLKRAAKQIDTLIKSRDKMIANMEEGRAKTLTEQIEEAQAEYERWQEAQLRLVEQQTGLAAIMAESGFGDTKKPTAPEQTTGPDAAPAESGDADQTFRERARAEGWSEEQISAIEEEMRGRLLQKVGM